MPPLLVSPAAGYFFQRPESHRVHHLRDSQYLSKNYSDLPVSRCLLAPMPPASAVACRVGVAPCHHMLASTCACARLQLWDILFGTFENPPANTDWSKLKFGFPEADENRLPEMVFKLTNVRKPHVSWWKWSTLSYSHMPVVPSIITGGSGGGTAIGPRRPNKHVNRLVSLTKLHVPTPSEVSRKSIGERGARAASVLSRLRMLLVMPLTPDGLGRCAPSLPCSLLGVVRDGGRLHREWAGQVG